MKTLALASLFFLLLMSGCSETQVTPFFHEGGYYSSRGEDGKYGIIKILVIDEHAFHVRIYANKFNALPNESDFDTLTLGGIGSPDGFGLGHAPMAKEGFSESEYSYLGFRKVQPSELDGYEIWKSQ